MTELSPYKKQRLKRIILNEKRKKKEDEFEFPSIKKGGRVNPGSTKPKDAYEDKAFFLKGDIFKKHKFKDKEIRKLSKNSILEVIARRRIYPFKRPKPHQQSPYRRFLCTANWKFLDKYKTTFGFKPPKGVRPRTPQWYQRHQLLIIQDLILKDWRQINLMEYLIVNIYPIRTETEQENFVKHYKKLMTKKKDIIKFLNK